VLPTRNGSLPLFRLGGIAVFLHWSWFVVAFIEISYRRSTYSSVAWNALEYLGLFALVLMHEFGHSLACRQVGGRADQIVLWPLGGVAYVAPPPRPGATLWSIAAGPLVNVVFVPLLFGLFAISQNLGWSEAFPDLHALIWSVFMINMLLLVFNLLPVYPLDGGQIVQTLLWFAVGRARSLMIAAALGFVGVAGIAALALGMQSIWIGIVAVFVRMNCWRGFQVGRPSNALEHGPRHESFQCPNCHNPPPAGPYWRCDNCRQGLDPFATQGYCPSCQHMLNSATACPHCGQAHPIELWRAEAANAVYPPRGSD
jgi:Zn-dependent protease